MPFVYRRLSLPLFQSRSELAFARNRVLSRFATAVINRIVGVEPQLVYLDSANGWWSAETDVDHSMVASWVREESNSSIELAFDIDDDIRLSDVDDTLITGANYVMKSIFAQLGIVADVDLFWPGSEIRMLVMVAESDFLRFLVDYGLRMRVVAVPSYPEYGLAQATIRSITHRAICLAYALTYRNEPNASHFSNDAFRIAYAGVVSMRMSGTVWRNHSAPLFSIFPAAGASASLPLVAEHIFKSVFLQLGLFLVNPEVEQADSGNWKFSATRTAPLPSVNGLSQDEQLAQAVVDLAPVVVQSSSMPVFAYRVAQS